MLSQVILVFDGMGGPSRRTVCSTNAGRIDVVYAAEQEADSWILTEVSPCPPPCWSRALFAHL